MAFRIRTQMVEKIPGNYKNKYLYDKNGLICNFCTISDLTQNHCKTCPNMEQMHGNLNMNNLEDLVIFFNRYLEDMKK